MSKLEILEDSHKMMTKNARKGIENALSGRIDPSSEMSLTTIKEGEK